MNKDRYSRQTILPEIGIQGQNTLKSSRVLCVGVGGLGSPACLYLAAAGVGTIGLIDADCVDESNLQRQVLFKTSDQGTPKVVAAKKHLNELNPDVQIIIHQENLSHLNAESILSNYDLVIDGSDNFETKFLINDAAYKTNIPVISGSIRGFEGEVALFFGNQGACYRCLHPTPPKAAVRNCAEAGVLGSIAGVIGTLQATLALQYLISKADPLHPLCPPIGQLSAFDFNGTWNTRNLKVHKNNDCPTCSLPPSEVRLKSSPAVCASTSTISTSELIKLLSENQEEILLIDVREPEEWETGYIPGAIHWPLGKIKEGNLPRIDHSFKKIVLYCKAGVRSKEAAAIFSNKGILNTYSLIGGFDSFR